MTFYLKTFLYLLGFLFSMKHTLKITLILIGLFFVSQVIGLAVTNAYIEHEKIEIGITEKATFKELPMNLSRPEVEEKTSFVYILVAILIVTVLVLVLMKFGGIIFWKLWYFLAIWLCLGIALAAFMNQILALIIGFLMATYKVFRPAIIVQNLTEVLIYGGLAAIFVPIMNVFSAVLLLVFISIYDFVAVYKTRHMIKLAKFQSKLKIFAGLLIPYKIGRIKRKGRAKLVKVRTAILGGGDIGFPLIFAGVVMKGLMLNNPAWQAFLKTMIIPFFATLALLYLLLKAEKKKFYPAMPFLTIGCLVGYFVVLAIA